MVWIDADSVQSGTSCFCLRLSGLFVSALIVLLLIEFRDETLATYTVRQVDRVEPSVHRASDLFDRDSIHLIARRRVVFLAHASTKQVTELGDMEVAMNTSPTTNFVVVQSQLLLRLAKTTFDGPPTEGDSQQPAEGDMLSGDGIFLARQSVGEKVFHFLGQHVPGHQQAVATSRRTVRTFPPELGPLHFPDLGPAVGVLDAVGLPRLLAEDGRVAEEVADFAGTTTATRFSFPTLFCRVSRTLLPRCWLPDPPMKIAWNLANEYLPTRIQAREKLAVATVQLVERPRRDDDSVGQRMVDQVQRNLWFGLEPYVVGDVSFFRRARSLAQTSGK